MTAVIPVQMLLPLLLKIFEARMAPCSLRDPLDTDALKLDIEQAIDVGKIVNQTCDPEGIYYLFAHQRTMSWIIVIDESPARLRDEARAEVLCVRDVKCACVTGLPALPDGRKIPLEIPAVPPVPCPAAKDK